MNHIESQTNYGNRLNRYCHPNFPNPKAVAHRWTTEKRWRPYSIYSALAVNGKKFLAVLESQAQYATVLGSGKELVYSSVCGRLVL